MGSAPGLNRLAFNLAPKTRAGPRGSLVVAPHVDGESLVGLVAPFEAREGFSLSGGYSGLVPSWFNYGDLGSYFIGTAVRRWPKPDHLWLLGCECGEVGCWPLAARVIALHDMVTWTEFTQPHRPEWDYAGFGPFTFDRTQYEHAVTWMAEQVETL
jgi:hypothetical protein